MNDIETAREHVARVASLEGVVRYERKRADSWRGIASAMGYEPNSHDKAKPQLQSLLDRIVWFRAQATETSVLAAINVERERADVKLRIATVALKEIQELSGEVNTSNYDHDDVYTLNQSYISAVTLADAALDAIRNEPV